MPISTYKILRNAIARSITSLSNAEERIKEIGLANPEACQIAANVLIDTSLDLLNAMNQVTHANPSSGSEYLRFIYSPSTTRIVSA